MASIKLITRNSKNPTNLYLRFINGKGVDIFYNTKVQVDPSEWDNKKSNYKNLKSVRNRIQQQARFEQLKSHVLYEFNEAYMMGQIIDREWLDKTVTSFFKRPVVEHNIKVSDHFLYYERFVAWWLEEKAPTWRTEKNKYLDDRSIRQYRSFEMLWKGFTKEQTKISAIDSVMIGSFVDYMENDGYSMTTIKRHVARLKFFLTRAEKEGIEIHSSAKQRTFYTKEEEVEVPYLNEGEIEAIFNLDLSDDYILDNIRDNFIIALWTGMRILDFNKNLSTENIVDGYIRIMTQKTKTRVMLPIHPNVQAVLDKRFGMLPRKYNNAMFNKKIKTVCMLANIDDMVKGKKFDKETKRKKTGTFEKWKLITSHSARRSFATNHIGKLPKEVIASVAGWSDVKMVDHYDKTTRKEHADKLADHWKNEK